MLNNYEFKSIFKSELNYFIKYKRSLGLKYENEVYRLKNIDKIFWKLQLKEKKITKETFYKLVERKNKINENYARHYGVVKDFCIFLIANNYDDIYYEEKKFRVINNYHPTIFNNEEILLLFNTMDYYKNEKIGKEYELYYSCCIFFRLLYSCGLRLSEGINITINDINFNENSIAIINSKRNVSRLIIFSNSMKICLKKYIDLFNISDSYLFPEIVNKKFNTDFLRKYYKQILTIANLNIDAHIHDLRHNYCNNALNQMLEKGYDENVVIVYLYKYMGHVSINETQYYLHLTDYDRSKLININDSFSKSLYEGVDFNE